MSEENFAYFLESLETLENLLHAETQAIAAQELDTIDEIILQKESSLKNLLGAKDTLRKDPRNNQLANEKIDYVMNLQARNALSFKKLKDRAGLKKKSQSITSLNRKKARSAYLD
mgnify:CR=1 FL=1